MVSVSKHLILYKGLVTLIFDHTNYNRNGVLKMGWIITFLVGAIIGAIASSITVDTPSSRGKLTNVSGILATKGEVHFWYR
jgi:hypothetical protein